MIGKKIKIGTVFTPTNGISIDLLLLSEKLADEKKWDRSVISGQKKPILRVYSSDKELEILGNGTLFYYQTIPIEHIEADKLCSVFNVGLEYVEKLQNLFPKVNYKNRIAFLFEGQEARSICKQKADLLRDIVAKNIGGYTRREYIAGESYSSVTFVPILRHPRRLR